MTTPDDQQTAMLEQLNRAIALHQKGELTAAESIYRALIEKRVQLPQPYSNLARIYAGRGEYGETIKLSAQALKIDPQHLESLILLGQSMKWAGETEKAELCYRAALDVKPGIPEVLYNLGNLLQEKPALDEAGQYYREALQAQPQFPLAHYNLANVCREQGQLDAAIAHYQQAIAQDPGLVTAHNNLGNALVHKDELEAAISRYQRALDLQPDYPDARYNLGNALYLLGRLDQAQPWFASAGIRDWRARCLYCLYKTGQIDAFEQELQAGLELRHDSPQIATLSAHHAINSGAKDRYRFCPDALSHVYQRSLPQLSGTDSTLRDALLDCLDQVEMSERHQGRLHQGVQSAGNLFLRTEAPLQQLRELICQQFTNYRTHFSASDCTLISHFPEHYEFESAWFIRMRQGGHLDAHIHETGWISGAVYLKLPDAGDSGQEGQLELGLHGDNYPVGNSEFPSRLIALNEGDIVLFPSSLFHRTIPYRSDQQRICIAFDLKPSLSRSQE
jgi:tetratricopeptide (TPR) repeat protein